MFKISPIVDDITDTLEAAFTSMDPNFPLK